MKKHIIITLLILNGMALQAQDAGGGSNSGFSLGINFGVGSYLSYADAPDPFKASYSQSASTSSWLNKQPVLDLEIRYQLPVLDEKVAVKLTGGFSYGYNPPHASVPGTPVGGGAAGSTVPSYSSVNESSNLQFAVGLGGDYDLISFGDLHLRAGAEVGLGYGVSNVNNPLTGYPEAGEEELYLGASVSEAYAIRAALVVGTDYSFGPFFVGLEVRPFAYTYAVYSLRPQVGLQALQADSYSFGAFVQPMLKIGFRF